MAFRKHFWGLAAVILLVLFVQQAAPRPAAAQSQAQEIFRLVNEFRAELGLPPFQYSATLAAAAQQQTNFMAENNVYSHTGAGGSSPQDRANALGYSGFVVENIVGGTRMNAQQGLTWWINSPVHYNTLVSSRHVEAGTGYTFGNGQHRYALVVGRPSDRPVSAAAAGREAQPGPIIIEPITLAPPREDGSIIHTVGLGQALWSLAAYYEVPLSDLLLYNNLEEGDFIQPGDEVIIRLAEGQPPPPTPTPPYTHIVREGQTLWTIAAIYDLKLSDLLWLNSLGEGGFIRPGQELIIRLREGQSPPPTPTPQLTYRVEEGDALWSIAARFGLSLEELLTLNNLAENTLLQPGQELQIRRIEPTPYPPTFTPRPEQALPAPPAPSNPTPAAAGTSTPAAVAQISAVEGGSAGEENLAASAGRSEEGGTQPPPLNRTAAGQTLLGAGAALLAILGIGLLWMSRRTGSP